ncbi:ALP1-like protein [Tanacetum coccineum]
MARPLFNWIVEECTSSIRQLTYDIVPDALDEYLQMSAKNSHLSLDHFCTSVMKNFGPEYLRKPTVTNVVKLIGITKKHMAPEIPFVANSVTYAWGYYFVDKIYPKLAALVKTISEPSDDDYKRIRYNQMHESARKDVERAFCILKKKWAILANPARAMKKRIMNMMYTCIILYNMVRKYKGYTIFPDWYQDEAHQPDDLLRSDEQVQQVMRHIRSSQAHQNLRVHLVEHLPHSVTCVGARDGFQAGLRLLKSQEVGIVLLNQKRNKMEEIQEELDNESWKKKLKMWNLMFLHVSYGESVAGKIVIGLVKKNPDYHRQKLLWAKQALALKENLKRSNDCSITPPVSKKSKKIVKGRQIEVESKLSDEEVVKSLLRKC